ncbi:MAG: ABC transporter substrate-binding protein [Subdoligranulum sp.]|nr:ABC transporter substrate-binding protein [Subdoligranulum sp.]
MKKAIALAMASVMVAGLLAGCGGSAANSTAASSEAASSEAASSEAASTSTEAATEAHTVNTTDPITLTISWWGGDARQAAYEAACKAFTEKYPNITVECTYGPWNGWEEAQSTALAAGTAADVMQVNWNWLFQYSGKGQSFANLNDYSDVLDLTQFPSNALDACTVAGSLQAVPVAMTGRIYYWNMATFKKAGLDHYPTTEQELLDAANRYGKSPYGEHLRRVAAGKVLYAP